MLLDLHLGDGDGLSLLPALRALRERPSVIVLTARDQVTDRIRGLDAGADDYLVKPYDPAELLARLRAVQRRRSASASPVLQLGSLQIDLARDLVRRDGVPVVLTQKEWALLRVMATRPERIHTREVLQDALYGFDDEADSNTLEVFISRLRRKLGPRAHPDPARPGLPAGLLAGRRRVTSRRATARRSPRHAGRPAGAHADRLGRRRLAAVRAGRGLVCRPRDQPQLRQRAGRGLAPHVRHRRCTSSTKLSAAARTPAPARR